MGALPGNIVTLVAGHGCAQFRGAGQVSHADRYARGEEFMGRGQGICGTAGPDDAVVDDRSGGRYARPDPHPADQPQGRLLPGGPGP